MADAVDESGRAHHVDTRRTVQGQAQQAVEAVEVIDMRMRHEHMANPQQFSRR